VKRYSIHYWDQKHKDWASDSDTDTDDLSLAYKYLDDVVKGWIEDNKLGKIVRRKNM
jgi:hypothetical protein